MHVDFILTETKCFFKVNVRMLKIVFIKSCIQGLGFQCVCFSNGSKASQLYQKRFDIQTLLYIQFNVSSA